MADTANRFITQWVEIATQNTNVPVTATKAAIPNQSHFITGYSVSCGAAPATPISVTISNGAATVDRIELPAAAFTPVVVNFSSPIRCDSNAPASIVCPAIGPGTRSTVTLRGFTVYP